MIIYYSIIDNRKDWNLNVYLLEILNKFWFNFNLVYYVFVKIE